MDLTEESTMQRPEHGKRAPYTYRRSKSLFPKVSETISPWIRIDLHGYVLVSKKLMMRTFVNLPTELKSEAW